MSRWESREADALDALESDMLNDAATLAKLQAQVNELTLALSATINVLAELCSQDLAAVERRVAAEMDALRPPPASRPASSTKGAVPVLTVTCAKCGASVSSTHTTITEAGTICDTCASA